MKAIYYGGYQERSWKGKDGTEIRPARLHACFLVPCVKETAFGRMSLDVVVSDSVLPAGFFEDFPLLSEVNIDVVTDVEQFGQSARVTNYLVAFEVTHD